MNIRISRKVVLIIECIILVAALVSVYMIYSGQVRERNELQASKSAADALLDDQSGLPNDKRGLEKQLADAQLTLNASRIHFPASVHSIEYGEYLFKIAAECKVSLSELKFPQPSSTTIGGVTYSVVSLTLPVSGAQADIFNFINTLRTDERFASTYVKSINTDTSSSATINIDIYGYKG